MYQQPPRRKARAIAISETMEARRKAMTARALMLLALCFGAADAAWTVHNFIAAR